VKSAAVALLGVLATFGIMYALCMRAGVDASPAILGAALAVGLARRPEHLDTRELLIKLVALPVVALAAGAVGLAFLKIPPLGAALFCTGVTLSVWARNFGERGAALGRIIALPFITMLVVPVHVDPGHVPLAGALLVIAAGLTAFVCTFAVQRFA